MEQLYQDLCKILPDDICKMQTSDITIMMDVAFAIKEEGEEDGYLLTIHNGYNTGFYFDSK